MKNKTHKHTGKKIKIQEKQKRMKKTKITRKWMCKEIRETGKEKQREKNNEEKNIRQTETDKTKRKKIMRKKN